MEGLLSGLVALVLLRVEAALVQGGVVGDGQAHHLRQKAGAEGMRRHGGMHRQPDA